MEEEYIHHMKETKLKIFELLNNIKKFVFYWKLFSSENEQMKNMFGIWYKIEIRFKVL